MTLLLFTVSVNGFELKTFRLNILSYLLTVRYRCLLTLLNANLFPVYYGSPSKIRVIITLKNIVLHIGSKIEFMKLNTIYN